MGRRVEVKGSRRGRWWMIGLAALVAVGAGLVWRLEAPPAPGAADGTTTLSAASTAFPVARRETRPTLDPEGFVGKARLAHQVAREIPGVLDQLYCYCECDKHLGHKSLLSCYTDSHAAT